MTISIDNLNINQQFGRVIDIHYTPRNCNPAKESKFGGLLYLDLHRFVPLLGDRYEENEAIRAASQHLPPSSYMCYSNGMEMTGVHIKKDLLPAVDYAVDEHLTGKLQYNQIDLSKYTHFDIQFSPEAPTLCQLYQNALQIAAEAGILPPKEEAGAAAVEPIKPPDLLAEGSRYQINRDCKMQQLARKAEMLDLQSKILDADSSIVALTALEGALVAIREERILQALGPYDPDMEAT